MSDSTQTATEIGRIPVVCASLSVNDLMKGDRRMEGEAYLTGGYAIRRRFADPSLYREAPEEVKALPSELAQVERDLADAYARWETLEGRKSLAGDGS